MTLTDYLKNTIAGIREDVRFTETAVYKETKTKTSSNDAYGRNSLITSGSRYFSGSLGWTGTRENMNTEGGFYYLGDMQVTASLSAKTGSGISLTDDGVYLVAEGVKLKILKVTDTSETKDMLITCERISQ